LSLAGIGRKGKIMADSGVDAIKRAKPILITGGEWRKSAGRRRLCHLSMDGNAYIKNGCLEHEMYKNGPKMSVLYIRRMIFSMYGGAQMLYNVVSHMDKSVIIGRR